MEDVRCGNNNSGVNLCYQGKQVCVAPYLVPTYQRYGATVGSCKIKVAMRVSYEPETTSLPLTLSLIHI